MVLISTPGSPAANSFTSREFAKAYHDGSPFGASWNERDAPEQARALVLATRRISTYLEWFGYPSLSAQALPFPRTGMMDREGRYLDTVYVPQGIQEATSEYAKYLLDTGDPLAVAEDALSSLKVGPIDLKFATATVGTESATLPSFLWAMLAPFGRPISGAGNSTTVATYRT